MKRLIFIFAFSCIGIFGQIGPIGPGNGGSSSGGGSSGGGGTPGYLPNQIVSGCGVEYTSGLSFTVGACNYLIAGVAYSSPLTNLTLTAADPTNPRIDLIVVNTSGAAVVLTGTPAGSPIAPTVNPATQLALTFGLTVAANATTPTGISATVLYDENTEWTCTPTANINCASTNNPYHGTKDIEATSAVLGNNFTLVKPAAGTVDLAQSNTLMFYIRSKAAWPTGNGGANAARFLSIWWQNGSTQKGNQIILKDGQFGFSSSITNAYQQISIPTSLFAINGTAVTTLVVQVSGNSGSSTFGWYIDQVTLQSGMGSGTLPTTLMNFKGTWNSNAAYNVNDTVVFNGIGYVALVANTNVSTGTTSTWAALGQANSAVYSQTFSSVTSVALTHNFNSTAVIFACYDNSSPPNYIGVNSAQITDANTVTVTFTNAQSGSCKVAGSLGAGGGGGSGTVSSVGLSLPNIFSVSGSPVTGSGTLTATLATQLTNLIWASPCGSTGTPTFRSLCQSDLPTIPRALAFTIGAPGGAVLTTSSISATLTVPFACSITAYNLAFGSGDTGTITVKFWKVATGTAVPTSGNSINTSGVGIASGTAIHSTTVSDFTSTAVSANDMIVMAVTAVTNSPTSLTGVLQCQ